MSKYCTNCGNKLNDSANFCTACGTIANSNNIKKEKDENAPGLNLVAFLIP